MPTPVLIYNSCYHELVDILDSRIDALTANNLREKIHVAYVAYHFVYDEKM